MGPNGSGKTTTAVKLALHRGAFEGQRVGLVTMDTYRAGAIEELHTYGDIAGVPVEVLYHPRDVAPAMQRLRSRDVIIVDTPGFGPGTAPERGSWRPMLELIGPDEVHLVLPATLREDVAIAAQAALAPFGITHLLLSKLDELPTRSGLVELTEVLSMPIRWISDGAEIPEALRPAAPQILAAVGIDPAGETARRAS